MELMTDPLPTTQLTHENRVSCLRPQIGNPDMGVDIFYNLINDAE